MLDLQTFDREDGKFAVTEEHDLQILRNESPEAGLRDQPEALKVNSNAPTCVTGYKLLFAMAALNLSAILINLDSSILSTVCAPVPVTTSCPHLHDPKEFSLTTMYL